MPNRRIVNMVLIAATAIIAAKAAVLLVYGHPDRAVRGFIMAAAFLWFVKVGEG